MVLPRHFVSAKLYDYLVSRFPALASDPDLRVFAAHLLLKARRDRYDSTRFVVDHRSVAGALGELDQVRRKQFQAFEFLKRFQREVVDPLRGSLPLLMSISDYSGKRARSASVEVPRPLYDLIKSEPGRLLRDAAPVCVAVGKALSPPTRTRLVSRERILLARESHRHLSRDGTTWLQYLNSQRGNALTRIVRRNYPHVVRSLLAAPREDQRKTAMDLVAIRHFPVPLYRSTSDTYRPIPNYPSLATIGSDYRRALLKSAFEFDIQSAVFRIIAALWNLPHASRFLRNNGNIWREIASVAGLTPGSASFVLFKKRFKITFNSIVYLAAKQDIERHIDRLLSDLNSPASPRAILKHPLIAELLKARQHVEKQVMLTGRVSSADRETLLLKNHSNIASLISKQVSSYELALLTPALSLVKKSDRASIILYQYDGFTVHVRDRARADAWKRKITKEMDHGARRLGIDLAYSWVDL